MNRRAPWHRDCRACPSRRTLVLAALLGVPMLAWAGTLDAMHADPIAPVILGVTGILFFAVIGRFGARKLGLPSVLGELVMGVFLGNVAYFVGLDLIMVLREGPGIFETVELAFAGHPVHEAALLALGPDTAPAVLAILEGPNGAQLLKVAHAVDVFSRYGVIFMLFLVGLETSVEEMREVGGNSVRVALIGVLLPFGLGFAASSVLMPGLETEVDMFVGATLAATSVGITARVLHDLQRGTSREARVILGAAVIDDVLGLLMLAVVSGIIVSGSIEVSNVATVVALAVLFLAGALFLSPYLLRFMVRVLHRLDLVEAKMVVAYLFVMVLAWLANLVGLATIVGAFAAGLIIHDAHFDRWKNHLEPRYSIENLVMPLEVVLVPIFFVLMGIQVKLETFFHWDVILLAGGLLVAAVIGKVASGLGGGVGINRLAVGIGMMPRGEVGLIFASIGKGLGVLTDALFSAIVLMVIVTTLAAPPLLKMTMGRPASTGSDTAA